MGPNVVPRWGDPRCGKPFGDVYWGTPLGDTFPRTHFETLLGTLRVTSLRETRCVDPFVVSNLGTPLDGNPLWDHLGDTPWGTPFRKTPGRSTVRYTT